MAGGNRNKYDKKVLLKVKEKFYKTVVKSVMMNGFERWAINTKTRNKIESQRNKNVKMDG